jgi:hypothetical protein
VRAALHSATDRLARRILVAAIMLAMSLGSATIFEAAAKADIARAQARNAAIFTDPKRRAAELAKAANMIETSWARPLAWHGAANETVSWIYGREARDADEDKAEALWRKSARAAERAVRLAPIQPASWARLASLADHGVRTSCSVELCLERSWLASKFLDTPSACARLKLAHRYGMLAPDDERVEWFARSTLHQRDVFECLSFLPRQELFHVILMFEIQQEGQRSD